MRESNRTEKRTFLVCALDCLLVFLGRWFSNRSAAMASKQMSAAVETALRSLAKESVTAVRLLLCAARSPFCDCVFSLSASAAPRRLLVLSLPPLSSFPLSLPLALASLLLRSVLSLFTLHSLPLSLSLTFGSFPLFHALSRTLSLHSHPSPPSLQRLLARTSSYHGPHFSHGARTRGCPPLPCLATNHMALPPQSHCPAPPPSTSARTQTPSALQ